MTSKEKKIIKAQQIKLGLTNSKKRGYLWEYILKNNLGIGYIHAQDLQKMGIMVLKDHYDPERPN